MRDASSTSVSRTVHVVVVPCSGESGQAGADPAPSLGAHLSDAALHAPHTSFIAASCRPVIACSHTSRRATAGRETAGGAGA